MAKSNSIYLLVGKKEFKVFKLATSVGNLICIVVQTFTVLVF